MIVICQVLKNKLQVAFAFWEHGSHLVTCINISIRFAMVGV